MGGPDGVLQGYIREIAYREEFLSISCFCTGLESAGYLYPIRHVFTHMVIGLVFGACLIGSLKKCGEGIPAGRRLCPPEICFSANCLKFRGIPDLSIDNQNKLSYGNPMF